MAACCQLAGAEVLARSGRIGDPPTQQRFQQIPWGLRHLRDRPEKCDAPRRQGRRVWHEQFYHALARPLGNRVALA